MSKEIVERVREDMAKAIAADCGYLGFEFEETREQWLGTVDKILAIKNLTAYDPDAELPSSFTNKGTQKTAIKMREDMKGWVKGVKNE